MANQVVEHLEIEGSGIYDIHDPSAAGHSDIDFLTTEVTTINNKIGNTDIGVGKTITSAIKELQDNDSSKVTSVDGQTGDVDLSNTYAPTSHTSVKATDATLGHVTLTDTIDNNETASAGKAVTPNAVKSKIDALTTLINQVDGRIPSLVGYVQNVNGQVPDPSAANGRVDIRAQHIPYSNTTSGMAATNVQNAIDELKATSDNFSEIEANAGIVSSELQTLTIDGITYTITGNVTANPTVTASSPDLTSIGIGGTNYIIAGGGGGSSRLSGLVDVSIDGNLSDGQVLIYNATMDMWTNGEVIATVADIGDIGNVSLTSLQNGQILQYDSTNQVWVNVDAPTGGGGDLSDLGDVNLGTLADKQVLQYDAATQKWINATSPAGSSSLSGLTDVNLSSLTNGEVLSYDNDTQKWINKAIPTGAEIDDTATAANKVWSSNKTSTEISNVPNTNTYNTLNTSAKTLIGAINEVAKDKNIANEYDSTTIYAVNDYCIYNGTLYKCIAAVTTAEAFDSTKWSATKVVNELNQGGGGSSTLSGLTDVDLTTPANDEALIYDSTAQKWVNKPIPTSVEIDDTTTSTTKVWSSNKTSTEIGNVPNTNTYQNLNTTSKTLIGAINENANDKNVSDAYNSNATYSAGDYCIYNTTLYKCNTDIDTPEAFDSTHWTATTVAKELGDNKIILTETLEAGETSLTFTDVRIQDNSWLTLAPENAILYPMGMSASAGSVTYTFAAQAEDVVFQLKIFNR